MHGWMDGWMDGYMYVCMYVHTCIYTYICIINTCTCISTCLQMKKPLLRRMNYYELFKDTHREKAPSSKTPALTKSTNMGIWGVGTSS